MEEIGMTDPHTLPIKQEKESWLKDYPGNWRRFTFARKVFFGLMLCVFTFWALSRLTGSELLLNMCAFAPFLLFFVWMPLGMLIRHWKCPRCRQPFSDAGFCKSCLAALQPGLGRAFFGYAASLTKRFSRDLELDSPERSSENRYVTDYCSHCSLPKYTEGDAYTLHNETQ